MSIPNVFRTLPPSTAGLGDPTSLAQVSNPRATPSKAPAEGKFVELKLGGTTVTAMPRRTRIFNGQTQTLYEVTWRGVSVQAALTGQIGPNQFRPGSPLKRQLEQALRASQAAASNAQPQSGFGPAFFAGVEGLKGAGAALAGRTGLMNPAEAEKVVARTAARARAIFKPTEQWGLTKLTEMLGGSVPYMAAPLGAAGAVVTLPLSGTAATVAGLGAAGVASFTQFTGTNLQRQVAEGKSLAHTDLGNAALAAVPMAALDTLSLKMLPGVGSLLSKAGSQVTLRVAAGVGEEALTTATKVTQTTAETLGEAITKPATQTVTAAAEAANHGGNVFTQGTRTATRGAAKPAGSLNLIAATGRAMGVEGSTEAAQQGFERGQAGLSFTDAQARQEYIDSFVGGALLGGTIAIPGHLGEHRRPIRALETVSGIQAGVGASIEPAQTSMVARASRLGNFPEAQGASGVRASSGGEQLATGKQILVDRVNELLLESGFEGEFDAAGWVERWLNLPNSALGGTPPREFIGTTEGTELLLDLIGAMAEGSYF